MKTLDRIIFSTIAIALTIIALRPFFAEAERDRIDVNIAAVGGRALGYGDPIRVTSGR